jgi:hypothetical protein
MHGAYAACLPDLLSLSHHPFFVSLRIRKGRGGVAVLLLQTDRKLRRAYKLRPAARPEFLPDTASAARSSSAERSTKPSFPTSRSVELRPPCSTVRTAQAPSWLNGLMVVGSWRRWKTSGRASWACRPLLSEKTCWASPAFGETASVARVKSFR